MIAEVNNTVFYLVPFFPFDGNGTQEKLSSEWLRKSVCLFVKTFEKTIKEKGGDPELFYNHLFATGKTRIGYPLIIYHFIDGIFYIVGINEGATTLKIFRDMFGSPFRMESMLFDSFHLLYDKTIPIGVVDGERRYSLSDWLPIHHTEVKSYKNSSIEKKAAILTDHLIKHIVKELGKYLNVCFDGLSVTIIDINKIHKPITYKGYEYPKLDILFTTNALLPEWFTLGNNKSLGFGNIKPK